MAKAGRVLKALLKCGWEEVHCVGSHHKLRRGSMTKQFAWHHADDLGPTALRIIAKDFGVPLDELKRRL